MGSMLMRKTFEFVGKKHAQTKRAVKGYTLHLSEITFAQARSNERGSCHIARLFWAQFFFQSKIGPRPSSAIWAGQTGPGKGNRPQFSDSRGFSGKPLFPRRGWQRKAQIRKARAVRRPVVLLSSKISKWLQRCVRLNMLFLF